MIRSVMSLLVLILAALLLYHVFGSTLVSIWHHVWNGGSTSLHRLHQLVQRGTTSLDHLDPRS